MNLSRLREIARPLPPFKPDLRAAIRAGRKTVTRRLAYVGKTAIPRCKDYSIGYHPEHGYFLCRDVSKNLTDACFGEDIDRHHYGTAGEYAYLREPVFSGVMLPEAWYDDTLEPVLDTHGLQCKWPSSWKRGYQTSRFMPRLFARTFVRLVSIRATWLHDITCGDIYKEGFPPDCDLTPDDWWTQTWDAINAKRGYPISVNWLVWRIQWEPVEVDSE